MEESTKKPLGKNVSDHITAYYNICRKLALRHLMVCCSWCMVQDRVGYPHTAGSNISFLTRVPPAVFLLAALQTRHCLNLGLPDTPASLKAGKLFWQGMWRHAWSVPNDQGRPLTIALSGPGAVSISSMRRRQNLRVVMVGSRVDLKIKKASNRW